MRHVPDAFAESLGPFVREMIAPGSILCTDGWRGYSGLSRECTIFIRSAGRGGPMDKPLRLVVARNVPDVEEIRYFVSNAPADEPLDHLLLSDFSRWRVERSFQDTKQKLGLGDYEGRCYTSPGHKLVISHFGLPQSTRSTGQKGKTNL